MDQQLENNILSRLSYIKSVLDEVEIRARLDRAQPGTLVLLNPEFINDVPGIQDLYELAGSFNSPLLGYRGTQSSLIDAFLMSADLKASTAILNLVMFGNYSQIQPEISKAVSAWLKLLRRVKAEIAEAGDHTTAPGTRNQPEKRSSFNDTEKRVIAEAIKKGWIQQTGDSYTWTLSKAAFAWFVCCIDTDVQVYHNEDLKNKNNDSFSFTYGGNISNWELWQSKFGYDRLDQSLSQLRKSQIYSPTRISIYLEIEKLVKDHKSLKGI